MNILLVDDERPALQELEDAVSAVLPTAQRFSFTSPSEALDFAEATPIDLAFLDIDPRFLRLFMGGINYAKALTDLYPDCNIIFCTSYAKNAKVLNNYCSAYLLKPVTPERVQSVLSRLRHPMLD